MPIEVHAELKRPLPDEVAVAWRSLPFSCPPLSCLYRKRQEDGGQENGEIRTAIWGIGHAD